MTHNADNDAPTSIVIQKGSPAFDHLRRVFGRGVINTGKVTITVVEGGIRVRVGSLAETATLSVTPPGLLSPGKTDWQKDEDYAEWGSRWRTERTPLNVEECDHDITARVGDTWRCGQCGLTWPVDRVIPSEKTGP